MNNDRYEFILYDMKRILAVFILTMISFSLLSFSGCVKEETVTSPPPKYDIKITLEDKRMNADVNIKMTITNEEGEEHFSFYPLKRHTLVKDLSGKQGEMEIASLSVNGEAAEFDANVENCSLSVFYPFVKGGTYDIRFDYSISLANDCDKVGYTEGYYIGNAFYPIPEEMKNKITEITAEVTLPKAWVAVTSGKKLEEKSENDTHTIKIRGEKERVFSFVASNSFIAKTTENSIPVHYYYRSDPTPDKALNIAASALNTFVDIFGKAPVEELYVVKAPLPTDSYSGSGVVIIDDDLVGEDLENAIIKGIAGEWWGYKIGADEEKKPYLNEPLIGFSALIYYLKNGKGTEFQRKVETYKEYMRSLVINGKDYSIGKSKYELNDDNELTITGALMWYELYCIHGVEVLEKLKAYSDENAYGTTTIERLFEAFDNDEKYTSILNAWLNGDIVLSL